MDETETKKIIEQFITNGMNIAPFHFTVESDKHNFFSMFESYLNSVYPDMDSEILFDKQKDIMVFLDNRLVCEFVISADYSTLNVFTNRGIDDEDLLNTITIMMLTIKELSMLVGHLASIIDATTKNKPTTSKIGAKIEEKRKYIKNEKEKYVYSTLPLSAYNKINEIEGIQKSIMKDIKKYTKGKDKK